MRALGVAVITTLVLGVGAAWGYANHRMNLNLSGYCYEKGRKLTDRELIHAAIRDFQVSANKGGFLDKRNWLTLTTMYAHGTEALGNDRAAGRFPYFKLSWAAPLTDSDIEHFLDTPMGKKCCGIARADEPLLQYYDWHDADSGNFYANLQLQKWGLMRAYVEIENRDITLESDGNLERLVYIKDFVPVGNCGEPVKPREGDRSWFTSGFSIDLARYKQGVPASLSPRFLKTFPIRISEKDYLPLDATKKLFSFHPFTDEPIEEGAQK